MDLLHPYTLPTVVVVLKFSELSLGIQGVPCVSSLRAFVPGSFAKDMVAVPFLALMSANITGLLTKRLALSVKAGYKSY